MKEGERLSGLRSSLRGYEKSHETNALQGAKQGKKSSVAIHQ